MYRKTDSDDLILENLRSHKPSLIGLERCTKAAVCIPLMENEVLFEVRSNQIRRQPGDICFPGGSLEPGETTFQAAVREIKEELLITEDQLDILGLMDVFYYGGNMMIYPYAAILRDYKGTYSKAEVAETFSVPLDFFLNTEPEVYYTTVQKKPEDNFPFEWIHGGKSYQWRTWREEMLFYRYENRIIWGITAKIMRSFVQIWKETRNGVTCIEK